MNTVIVIEGIVTKVERSTNGYGESERTVGLDVHIQSRWEELDPADGSTSPYVRTSTIHLPKGFRQPMVGQKLTLVMNEGNDGTDDPAMTREERDKAIADLVAEEPDEDDDTLGDIDDIEGHPDYDSIKQGG
jgi:hypothetical protein